MLAIPAMAALRRHFDGAHLAVAAPPAVAAIFREDTDVRPDQVIELPERPQAVVAAIEGEGYDVGVLFPNSFGSAWLLRRARVRDRWGYATAGRGLLLTKRVARPRTSGVLHQADYYRALVRGCGVPCDDEAPRLRASRTSLERAGVLLKAQRVAPDARLVGLAPGAAYGQAKQWPPERVAEVAARLARERGATCVVLGAPHDRPTARAIESWLRAHASNEAARVVDLTGRTSLGALVGVTARCQVLVSNDSGAMHLAAALGRPVVAIFGPTDDRATRPLGAVHDVISAPAFCRPCLLRDCPIDHRCMKRITPAMVFAAVSKHLAFARAS